MNGKLNRAFSISLLLAATTFHAPVNSQTVCKGLIENECAANTSCVWVNGYVTKNGAQVNGYCRVKPGSKAASSESDSRESITKPAKDS